MEVAFWLSVKWTEFYAHLQGRLHCALGQSMATMTPLTWWKGWSGGVLITSVKAPDVPLTRWSNHLLNGPIELETPPKLHSLSCQLLQYDSWHVALCLPTYLTAPISRSSLYPILFLASFLFLRPVKYISTYSSSYVGDLYSTSIS